MDDPQCELRVATLENRAQGTPHGRKTCHSNVLNQQDRCDAVIDQILGRVMCCSRWPPTSQPTLYRTSHLTPLSPLCREYRFVSIPFPPFDHLAAREQANGPTTTWASGWQLQRPPSLTGVTWAACPCPCRCARMRLHDMARHSPIFLPDPPYGDVLIAGGGQLGILSKKCPWWLGVGEV